MLWLICYDIPDDKRRTKLAKRLEQHCQRVQYSVFECPVNQEKLEELLQQRWLPLLNLNEDSLRIYPLDANAQRRTRVFGSPPPYEPPDYLIL
jgi:CRISPR-associated protein Cas2